MGSSFRAQDIIAPFDILSERMDELVGCGLVLTGVVVAVLALLLLLVLEAMLGRMPGLVCPSRTTLGMKRFPVSFSSATSCLDGERSLVGRGMYVF